VSYELTDAERYIDGRTAAGKALKPKRMRRAAQLRRQGHDLDYIADAIGTSPATASAYCVEGMGIWDAIDATRRVASARHPANQTFSLVEPEEQPEDHLVFPNGYKMTDPDDIRVARAALGAMRQGRVAISYGTDGEPLFVATKRAAGS
jgi:hypothetical protein